MMMVIVVAAAVDIIGIIIIQSGHVHILFINFMMGQMR